jgi:hypothetical protein
MNSPVRVFDADRLPMHAVLKAAKAGRTASDPGSGFRALPQGAGAVAAAAGSRPTWSANSVSSGGRVSITAANA